MSDKDLTSPVNWKAAAPHPTQAPMPPMHWKLMEKAKERGLFNFFLPEVCQLNDAISPCPSPDLAVPCQCRLSLEVCQLTCMEYAPLQEILGSVPEANFAMNCMAPDTGNMEVLEKYGNLDLCSDATHEVVRSTLY